jgi:hypothetical protein
VLLGSRRQQGNALLDPLNFPRIASRQQRVQILWSRELMESRLGCEVHQHLLAGSHQIENVVERALASTVPQHHAALRFPSHGDVLGGVVPKILPRRMGFDSANFPVPHIVPTGAHAENSHATVVAIGEVLLNSLVRAVRISDKYPAFLVGQIVQAFPYGGVQPGYRSRSSDENGCRDRLRVLVKVSRKTAAARPPYVRLWLISVTVAPDR